MCIKAVLFDLDGVLLDSDEALYLVFKDALERFGGVRKTREEIMRHHGSTDFEWLKNLAPELGDLRLEEISRWCDVQYADYYLPNYAKPMPDAINVLHDLRRKELKLGVVTNQTRIQADTSLRLLGFDDFDAVVSASEASKPKPSAEPLLKALSIMRVSLAEAIYIGDTVLDAKCGSAASVKTFILAGVWNSDLNCKKLYALSDLMVKLDD